MERGVKENVRETREETHVVQQLIKLYSSPNITGLIRLLPLAW